MAGSYNKIILIGNVGRDPETRYLPSGDAVASFSVATSERRKGQDGQQQEQTTWFRVSAFGKLAETCQQYLHKGSYVYVEGALAQQEYTDREGATRQSLEVRAREMRMLDKRGEGGEFGGSESVGDEGTGAGPGRAAAPRSTRATPAADDTDDIPF